MFFAQNIIHRRRNPQYENTSYGNKKQRGNRLDITSRRWKRRERRYIFKIVPSLNNLVDDVRFSESWVVLDDGLDSLADSWGRWDYGSWGSGNSGYWSSSGVGGGSVWVSSISVSSSIWVSSGIWVSSSIWVSSISESVKTGITESSVWESSWNSSWEDGGGSWGGSLFTGSSFIESSLEFSLGSSNFRGILYWFWEGVFMDWLSEFSNWGNWEVGSLDTEAKTISNVVKSLDKSVGISVAVRSSYSPM